MPIARQLAPFAALAALALIIAILGALWVLRRPAPPWQQSAAVAVPTTVTTVGALRLILDRPAAPFDYHLECLAAAPQQTLVVGVQTALGTRETTFLRDCPNAGAIIARGTVGDLGSLPTGTLVTVSLAQRGPDGGLADGVAKVSKIYMIGTDGQLRAGAGSVWR